MAFPRAQTDRRGMRWLWNLSVGAIALAVGGSLILGALALIELLIERLS